MKKTKFFNLHEKLGAKIVDFAGYKMPIQYSSIIAEHKAVRHSVGVFDVSHMGEIFIEGDRALDFVQLITVNDASKLNAGRVQYSAMCYEDGGIVDDLLVYCISDKKFMLVVNASNIEKDFEWMNKQNHFGVSIKNLSDDYSLLAIQGPNSKLLLQKICDFNLDLEYYHFKVGKCCGVEMIVSRTGYTGELGYELYFQGDEEVAESVWNQIFEAGKEFNILPVGLAARDSLRLEIGYCLYGNDIDQTTNPLEAGLSWITKLNKQNFIGKEALLKIKNLGLSRRLVPLLVEEKAFPRQGYEVSHQGKIIGKISSGTVSPILEKGIALAYVDYDYSKEGIELTFNNRGKDVSAQIVKLPFVNR
ncbi:MAG: glycine cleavage system protein T [Chlorobiaceae bacterium]|nr:glycine cleavage system protein T [Chlorobiaceae bacterium]MBA4310794.1 glycine cleavage system protein T [Chlorobiaceae bacterium]